MNREIDKQRDRGTVGWTNCLKETNGEKMKQIQGTFRYCFQFIKTWKQYHKHINYVVVAGPGLAEYPTKKASMVSLFSFRQIVHVSIRSVLLVISQYRQLRSASVGADFIFILNRFV
jgi:hypothetical protein